MRVNNLLGITDGSVKRPMKITESDKNDRTIVKNQKDIDNWNALDDWAVAILSTFVELAPIEKHVTATSSYSYRFIVKTQGHLRAEIRSLEAGPVESFLRYYKNFE